MFHIVGYFSSGACYTFQTKQRPPHETLTGQRESGSFHSSVSRSGPRQQIQKGIKLCGVSGFFHPRERLSLSCRAQVGHLSRRFISCMSGDRGGSQSSCCFSRDCKSKFWPCPVGYRGAACSGPRHSQVRFWSHPSVSVGLKPVK